MDFACCAVAANCALSCVVFLYVCIFYSCKCDDVVFCLILCNNIMFAFLNISIIEHYKFRVNRQYDVAFL